MKDREISRLVLVNIGLLLAVALCAVFFFWLHGSVGAAPVYTGGEVATDERGVLAKRPSESVATSTEVLSPATTTFEHFTYQDGMSLTVSGKCLAEYFVILIFPATVDYRNNPLGFNFNTAYPCSENSVFSKTLTQSDLHLSSGVSYYVIKADEKDTGNWYNPR